MDMEEWWIPQEELWVKLFRVLQSVTFYGRLYNGRFI